MPEAEVFEVEMDIPATQQGVGKRRRRRRTQKDQSGGAAPEVSVSFEEAGLPMTPVSQTGGALKKPQAPATVAIAPPKKKPAKLMLVPKAPGAPHKHRQVLKKTFKAKRVHVTIDNTAKTQKHRRQVLGKVDAMDDEQVRAAAVSARLTRRESVAKVPAALLRQMLRDYQTMKGMLL